MLPAKRLDVSGSTTASISTSIPTQRDQPGTAKSYCCYCRPLHPVIPLIHDIDFAIIGVGRKRQEGLDQENFWSLDHEVPAVVYSELYVSLNFDMSLPLFGGDDEIILMIRNNNPGCRTFAFGWLVEYLEGP